MVCPACGAFQPRAENCVDCGVCVDKHRQPEPVESEKITEPVRAESPKKNIFVRVFSGDVSLPITYWVWGGLGNVISAGAYAVIEFNYASIVMSPYGDVFLNSFYAIVLAYVVFIWVAVWRSAGKYQGSGWGAVARFMVALSILGLVSEFVTGLNQGPDDEASIAEEMRLFDLSLPTMLDESTRMDSVTYDNDRIVFNHTIIDSTIDEFDVDSFNEIIRANLTESLCVDPDTKDALDFGTRYAYAFVDMNGISITEIDIDLADCQ